MSSAIESSRPGGLGDAAAAVAKLVRILEVERIDLNLFRGSRSDEPWRRVFGGEVIGQALMAACRTVPEDRRAHSLHAYFMRPGDPHAPIIYEVERDRDGSSFTSRRVVALQHGARILNLAASFHLKESGLHHQFPMPHYTPPEELKSAWLELPMSALPTVATHRVPPLDIRTPEIVVPAQSEGINPTQSYWFRAAAPLPVDPVLHRILLAYVSDLMLLGTSLLPHGIHRPAPQIQEASLDHALWIHEDLNLENWHLYCQDSPWSGGARGINRGLIYARDGTLVASVAQEGLIRLKTR